MKNNPSEFKVGQLVVYKQTIPGGGRGVGIVLDICQGMKLDKCLVYWYIPDQSWHENESSITLAKKEEEND